MALASPRPRLSSSCFLLRDQGFDGELNLLDLLCPEGVIPWGGLFLPDPSIGRWALWRQPVGARLFRSSADPHLVHPAALAHLQDLVSEPVQPWDALICSSTAGRSVVEAVLNSREEALAERCGGDRARLRAYDPSSVIPLPFPTARWRCQQLIKEGPDGSGLPEQRLSCFGWDDSLFTPSSIHGRLTPSWSVWPEGSIILLCCWSAGLMTNHLRSHHSLLCASVAPMCTSSAWVVLSQ